MVSVHESLGEAGHPDEIGALPAKKKGRMDVGSLPNR